MPRIAVVGAGANGGALAADIQQSGIDVTVIDPWWENIEAIKAKGISVEKSGSEEVTALTALHICEIAQVKTKFDIVFVAVKAYDTAWIIESIKPILAADGVVVGIQNGLTHETVSSLLGPSHSVGCVVEVAASMFVPGKVVQQAPFWFGIESGKKWSEEICHILSTSGGVKELSDIDSAKWMKLVANSAELVTSAIVDLPLAEAIQLPGMLDVMAGVGAEAAEVAVRSGRKLISIFDVEVTEEISAVEFSRQLLDKVLTSYTLENTLTTVLQDWRKGRRAEIDEINGSVVHVGKRVGYETALNTKVYEAAQRIQNGELIADPRNAVLFGL